MAVPQDTHQAIYTLFQSVASRRKFASIKIKASRIISEPLLCYGAAQGPPCGTVPGAGIRAAALPPAMRTLCIWDFDWSMVEENSDTWVIDQIGAHDIYTHLRESQGLPWTRLMDATLSAAAAQLGATPADVRAAVRALPVDAGLADWLCGAATARRGMEMVIVSDANSVYIAEVLAHHGLTSCVAEVHTNPAAWDERTGALRVAPLHAAPHGCHRCPANMCKGQVVRDVLARRRAVGAAPDAVVYVGDGRGDFCPTVQLLEDDALGRAAVLARTEYPDGKSCALWVMLESMLHAPGSSDAHGGGEERGGAERPQLERRRLAPGRRVEGWSTPAELVALLQECTAG